ncbi:ankyrin repeat domain protein [Nitzschia inconspicua]|uniref:Ankyrin repeat domain protein n=1 Tax=Nitzschia inconspicua TaxID=303405 RepID=A0A9K3KN81_9STRA|nr:ankyrin repeat domain protein [Nitzschia inconspicua]
MDGTLTIPNLDFDLMYQRCNVDKDKDILHEINHVLSPSRAEDCRAIIEEMEAEGRRTLQLITGAGEVLAWCRAHDIPTALVTRNTRLTVDRLEELLLKESTSVNTNDIGDNGASNLISTLERPHVFDVVIARDDDAFPPKPNPASLRHILQHHWGIHDNNNNENYHKDDVATTYSSSSVVMVGDSPSNDIAYGKAAGTKTALLDTARQHMTTETSKESPANHPDCTIQGLWELPRWLWLNMDIPGSLGTYSPLLKYDTPVNTGKAGQAAVDGDLERLQQLPTDELFQACSQTGNTPLIWAADAGHVNVVEYLLQQYQSSVSTQSLSVHNNNYLNSRGYLGATAVSRAACRGHATCLERLAAAGADLDVPNDKMQFPLHFAAFKQKLECVHTLLNYGANPFVLDRKGRTPSLDTSNDEIRQVLEESMKAKERISNNAA